MEEDGGVKAAPVTRLRRRLSVETDETKSPSAPSTPTKKRATRLAAKPQLELIDEHAVTNSPKKTTRKSISRDITEPEEKPVTPARRSTRTKSNTSLVSEADEKPLTPARRSTRIKSNTSIVSETAQSVESPRAKRAVARRNSQIGSDTEAPVTPARTRRARKISTSSIDIDETPSVIETALTPGRTRRTRKGSTSSIDTTAEAVQADKPSLVTEVIAEEPEGKLRKSTSTDTSNANENKDDSPTRKSPRLLAKKGRKSTSEDANEKQKQSQENSEDTDHLLISTEEPNKEIIATEVTSQHNISMCSANLIKDLDTKLKKKISDKNKSMSDVEPTTEQTKKRDRTKSWTTLCASPTVESNFYSDNESTKKKLKKHGNTFNNKRLSSSKDAGSGDGLKQTTAEQNNGEEKEQSFNTSKKNKKSRNNSISNKSASLENSIFEATKEVDISNESNKENLLGMAPVVKDLSVAELLFETAPSADVKSMVFIEDSDSNTGSVGKQGKQIDGEDQCVPVVLHQTENDVESSKKQESSDQNNIFAINNKVTNDDSVEPMDIDETIPDNVSLTVFTDEGKEYPKSSQTILQEAEDLSADTLNKSRSKSSVSNSVSQIFVNSNSRDQSMQPCKSSLLKSEAINNAKKTSMSTKNVSSMSSVQKSTSEDIENIKQNDILAIEQNVLIAKSKTSLELDKSISSLPDSTSEDNAKVDNVVSLAESKKSKKIRKSSLTVGLEPNNSLAHDLDKSKRDFTSHSASEDNEKEENENKGFTTKVQDVSVNESKKSKKSRKSLVAQESDNILDNNYDKSKRKSNLSYSFSQDIDLAQSNKEVIIVECTQNESSRKSSISMAQDADDSSKNSKNSKRKSSLSNSMFHEKTENESKSTLVLSQLKDISAAENSVSTSPRNELSKSMNINEANKDAPKQKNLALNYLTSTPVQEKNIEKIAIQMNTPDITPNNMSKKCINTSKSTPKKKFAMFSDSSENNSSDEGVQDSEEDEESSQDESNLFDDQAEEAGDDYESGDSQDDEERDYEKDNEIVETGETLTSDEDISNDSDYEKDSFIVSSDEDDNELLSGSGDDLDMSDNELTLSAKSKKKYNERKLKEQKKASREIFEARHGLNQSDKKLESNKSNRSRLDSTLLKSDEDVMPPKKNKRMRLESIMESSQVKSDIKDGKSNKDISTASDEDELGYKKKKSKRLSESVCHENTMNENEITICNQSTTENKKDPLLQIKTEPKTPIKDLEISRVHVTDDVEQVLVDENMSILKLNESSDPLQATARQEDDSDNYDSSSENEEIANNYDSVLRKLNKENKKQIKSHDLNKRAKRGKEPIVDELNLTQTNISKKDISSQAKEKSVKRVFKKLADSDESSESIDLHLLFSDESNGSDNKGKNSEEEVKESIMPLKKTEAKTDIRRSIGTDRTDDANDDGSLNFFIDTKGDLSDKATTRDDAVNESESDEAPVEVLYVSNKKTSTSERKKNKVSESEKPNSLETGVTDSKTLASGKKKKLASQESPDKVPILNKLVSEKKNKLSISHDDKVLKTPVSGKKKVQTISDSYEVITREEIAEQEGILTDEVTASNTKKRKRKLSANKTIDDIESEGTEVLNTSQQLNESGGFSNKNKKVKISTSIDDRIEVNITETEEPVIEQNTKKNKRFENKQLTIDSEPNTKKSKKRKERDEEENGKISKVFKENSFDKVHVPRLPPGVIDQLEEMPGVSEIRKAKIVSTSNFVVEETLKRKNKPSDFLEETVYLNDDENDAVVKKKSNIKRPKVLPFLPTVSTSDSGFTTNFHVNVISQKMEFVARNNEIPNFKNDYLNNKRNKKLRTYELYKKQRNTKLTKY